MHALHGRVCDATVCFIPSGFGPVWNCTTPVLKNLFLEVEICRWMFILFLCRLNECSWRHIAIQILYVHPSLRSCVRPLKFRLTFFKLLLFEQVRFNYNQTWIIGALWEPSHYDALGGHMTRSKVIWGQIIRSLKFRLTFFKLLLFEQVRFNDVQSWIIGALWEHSHYDALGGHMTRSNC